MNRRDHSSELQFFLQRVLDDKSHAFDDLAYHASERLRRMAASMLRKYQSVRRWEETDDVLQSALIRLHRSVNEVKPDSVRAFFGLAATQIRRELLDLSRHYYGAHGIGRNHQSNAFDSRSESEKASPGLEQRAVSTDRPTDLAGWTEFHQAIEGLPKDEKEVFELIWYGGILRKDVAKLLDINEKTVLRRFTRARVTLYQMMSGDSPES